MRSAVIPMSISEVRPICLTIDAISCGIVRSVYIAAIAGQPFGRSPQRPPERRSGAELGQPGVVGQARRDDLAETLTGGNVLVEGGDPTQQEELVGRQRPPAAIEVELGEEEVQVRVRGRDADREIACVDGGNEPARPTVRPGGGEEPLSGSGEV